MDINYLKLPFVLPVKLQKLPLIRLYLRDKGVLNVKVIPIECNVTNFQVSLWPGEVIIIISGKRKVSG